MAVVSSPDPTVCFTGEQEDDHDGGQSYNVEWPGWRKFCATDCSMAARAQVRNPVAAFPLLPTIYVELCGRDETDYYERILCIS